MEWKNRGIIMIARNLEMWRIQSLHKLQITLIGFSNRDLC